MKVSFVIPSFNQGKFIERTLNSIFFQTYFLREKFEVLVIDGGSTDNTIEILKKYSHKINWVSGKDNGQADAINKGIKKAKGDIIGWINSDDTYAAGSINYIIDFFNKNPKINILYGMANHVDENDRFIDQYPTEIFSGENLLKRCFICQPALFFRKKLCNKFGFLDEKLNYCMDYEFWLRLSLVNEKFHYVKAILANSRMYSDNKTLYHRKDVHLEINKMFLEKIKYVPDRWIFNYAHVVLDKRNISRNTIIFKILVFFMSLYYALIFNNKISATFLKNLISIYKKQK
jgi:glycosyltransferase involved in cell wall biosynthesis